MPRPRQTPEPTQGDQRFLSTAEVARALGVGVSTVKRWVDDGVLPAHKTTGGHRKLFLADVVRLARDGRLPHVDLGRLDPSFRRSDDFDAARQARELGDALEAGDALRTRALMHGPYFAGTPLDVLADQVIAPAMTRIGHGWESGRLDVMHEHRATQLAMASLYELKALLERTATPDRPLAVGGGPEGDPSLMANLLLQMVLLDAGWEAINLGPNTPFASFHVALMDLQPDLVWISTSHLPDRAKFIHEYTAFFHQAADVDVPIALGGLGIDAGLLAEVPYTMYGRGMAQFTSFVRTLYGRPRPPRRGRPPASAE